MSSSPALLEPADLARQRDEDAQYYRAVLHKLIAMDTDLAEAVHRQALAAPAAAPQNQLEDAAAAPGPTPTQATTFDRLARTVRRTIALARKLSEPAREASGPQSRPTECPHERRTDRAETDALDAEPWAEPCERPEGADCDADEDFDDDLDDDLDDQSLDDLIASLRHDSGLATLTDAQLRQLGTAQSAQAGTPGENRGLRARDARPPGAGSTDRPKSAPSRTGNRDPVAPPPAQPGTGPPAP